MTDERSAELRAEEPDPATWAEIGHLNHDLRVAAAQLDYALQLAQNWSRKAATDE